ncbi:MAG TPA: adenylyl-sulfate kinase [Candidatus Manganitrophaceae bacterium]|nr:adenylyl-sulfate kinase [Candidatus Manganitrophaceae bacterium]
MTTAESDIARGFAVWITGLPASGKSALTLALVRALSSRGVDAAVLESDALRRVFTPHPRYDEEEREVFYGAMAYVGRLLADHGVPVIFDATANRRAYRDRARGGIARFLEVYVDTPLSVCISRDPKGIYRKAQAGAAATVPGLQAGYEPPLHPEVVMKGDRETPERGAERVIARLSELGFLPGEAKRSSTAS